MNCPVCNQSLDAVKYAHMTYHICSQCEGIWVNTKMLRNLATRIAADTNIKSSKPVPFLQKTVVTEPDDERIRLCPQCTAGMKKLNYAYGSSVIIDRCDACESIWLDEGEIIKLAQFHQFDENSIRAARVLMDIQSEKEAQQAAILFALMGCF